MSEADTIRGSADTPATVDTLAEDLAALGVMSGMVLLVHSSLSAMGWVCGGPVAVILALERALGANGTLVMPTHSTGLTDPADWHSPPVPESWWPLIRDTLPPYDPAFTPTRGMGAIPETFRKQSGVLRSAHPAVSFAAWGRYAKAVTSGHRLDFAFGEHSPLARVYERDGSVLLIGVGHKRNTSLHLAEYRADFPTKRIVRQGSPVCVKGTRRWKTYQDLFDDSSDFECIGEDFRQSRPALVKQGHVGIAAALLIPQRPLVDYAVAWIQENRNRD